MFRKWIALVAVTCLCLCGVSASEYEESENELPTVRERVDAVVVYRVRDNEYGRVVFIRNDTVLATRLNLDDMVWLVEGDDFVLLWQDYSVCHRVVRFKSYSSLVMSFDPLQAGQVGPWWAMNRNMRDLKQPD